MPQISFPMEYYIQIINKDMLPIKAVFYVSCLNKKKRMTFLDKYAKEYERENKY